jgi:tRNA (guanine-N7-)-methyltransferase
LSFASAESEGAHYSYCVPAKTPEVFLDDSQAMGRRALRKIDPNLDLTPYLKTFDDLPAPLGGTKLFGRQAPLEIEVGSGKGLFLTNAAEQTPAHDFLGVEVSHKYARHAASRLAKRQLSNAKMVDGDALQLFRDLLPDAIAAAVHIYFPDPWWKKRHRKRRVMRDSLLRDVERVLTEGGRLHFWTDVAEYFDETLKLIRDVTNLTGPIDVPERPAEHHLDYRTHFERRMRLHDEPVYRSEFSKGG